jgi:hypothetical protein
MQSRQLIENKFLILIKPSTYRNINMLAVRRKPVVRRLREITAVVRFVSASFLCVFASQVEGRQGWWRAFAG